MPLTRRRRQRGHAIMEGALVLIVFLKFPYWNSRFRPVSLLPSEPGGTSQGGGTIRRREPNRRDWNKNVAVYNFSAGGAQPLLPGLTTGLVSVAVADAGTPAARVTVSITGYPFQFFSPLIAGSRSAQTITATMLAETP